jgi:uncharacterized protein with WD repeat
MNNAEHFCATDVEWDPTGRYVVYSNKLWYRRQMQKIMDRFV